MTVYDELKEKYEVCYVLGESKKFYTGQLNFKNVLLVRGKTIMEDVVQIVNKYKYGFLYATSIGNEVEMVFVKGPVITSSHIEQ